MKHALRSCVKSCIYLILKRVAAKILVHLVSTSLRMNCSCRYILYLVEATLYRVLECYRRSFVLQQLNQVQLLQAKISAITSQLQLKTTGPAPNTTPTSQPHGTNRMLREENQQNLPRKCRLLLTTEMILYCFNKFFSGISSPSKSLRHT